MPDGRLLTGAQAIREALDLTLREKPEVFLLGLGVTDPGGIFGTTNGLLEAYGPGRVIEPPTSENALTGIAVGAALMGRRPVLMHQRVDFALLSLEQLFNNAAKTHYVTLGRHKVPVTIRLVIGRGWGQGPQHSQALETVFSCIPGLKVVMPSTPADMKGMLIASIDDDSPVVFLEHRWLHHVSDVVPAERYATPLDGPRIVRRGRDLSIVASSYMTLEALRAADCLARIGCEAEVLDLRVLRPLVIDPIEASLVRTGRLIVCETGWKVLGPGAEIVAALAERCFAAFRQPPIRIGLPDHPTPSTVALAQSYYPGPADIIRAAGRLCALPETAVAQAIDDAQARRAGVPADKPDPSFTGPF